MLTQPFHRHRLWISCQVNAINPVIGHPSGRLIRMFASSPSYVPSAESQSQKRFTMCYTLSSSQHRVKVNESSLLQQTRAHNSSELPQLVPFGFCSLPVSLSSCVFHASDYPKIITQGHTCAGISLSFSLFLFSFSPPPFFSFPFSFIFSFSFIIFSFLECLHPWSTP